MPTAKEWFGYTLAAAALIYGLKLKRDLKTLKAEQTPEEAKYLAALDKSDAIRPTDPEAAERMLAEAEKELATYGEAHIADLRQRAQTDPEAAKQLRRELDQALKGYDLSTKVWKKEAGKDPRASTILRNIEMAQAKLRSEIATLDQRLRHESR